MAMIYVRVKEGRKMFYQGRIIPNDKFIPVTDDPFIRRLVDHWGDLEVEGEMPKDTPRPQTKMKPVEKGPTPPVPGGGRRQVQPAVPFAPGTGAPPRTDPQAQN